MGSRGSCKRVLNQQCYALTQVAYILSNQKGSGEVYVTILDKCQISDCGGCKTCDEFITTNYTPPSMGLENLKTYQILWNRNKSPDGNAYDCIQDGGTQMCYDWQSLY